MGHLGVFILTSTWRASIRTFLLGISYHLGGPRLNDALRPGRVKVLIYHGIPTRNTFDGIENYHGYNVSTREFEQHLEYLKRRCNVVSLADAVAGRGLSKSRTNVVLSFDDGYENNYSNAFRLLQHYEFPAIFAIPTGFVCDQEPLFNDVFEYAVNRSPKKQIRISWEGKDHDFSISGIPGRLTLFDWLMVQSTSVAQTERKALTTAALDDLGVSVTQDDLYLHEDYRPLTTRQVSQMATSGLATFASHSVHHYALSKLDAAGKRAELIDSKRQIEGLTGSSCDVLCVPGGQYDDECLDEASAAGYEYVLTSDRGVLDLTDRTLNRNSISHSHNIHEFADLVHGPVFESMAAARRARAAATTLSRHLIAR